MYKVSVSCESLPRSHSAVVCGGWHLALRLSCLPPPLFSALQWDHVVLLISQQWPYSLPFPLFSLPLSPHFLIPSCLHLLPSPTHTHTQQTILQLLSSCHVDSLHFIMCHRRFVVFFFSSNPGPSPPSRPLTQLFGALAVARQLSKFHQSVEVPFGSHSYSWRRVHLGFSDVASPK